MSGLLFIHLCVVLLITVNLSYFKTLLFFFFNLAALQFVFAFFNILLWHCTNTSTVQGTTISSPPLVYRDNLLCLLGHTTVHPSFHLPASAHHTFKPVYGSPPRHFSMGSHEPQFSICSGVYFWWHSLQTETLATLMCTNATVLTGTWITTPPLRYRALGH